MGPSHSVALSAVLTGIDQVDLPPSRKRVLLQRLFRYFSGRPVDLGIEPPAAGDANLVCRFLVGAVLFPEDTDAEVPILDAPESALDAWRRLVKPHLTFPGVTPLEVCDPCGFGEALYVAQGAMRLHGLACVAHLCAMRAASDKAACMVRIERAPDRVRFKFLAGGGREVMAEYDWPVLICDTPEEQAEWMEVWRSLLADAGIDNAHALEAQARQLH